MNTQQQNNNFLDQYIKLQKDMFQVWKESFFINNKEKECHHQIDEKSPIGLWNDWMNKSYQAFFKNINPIKESSTQWGMLNASEIYQSLYEFWKNLSTMHDQEQGEDFYTNWQKEYSKILSNHFMNYLPDFSKKLLKESMNTYEIYLNTSKNFYIPWINNLSEGQELLGKSFMGDADAFLEYGKLWRGNYEKTFGKVFDLPGIGIGKEYFENEMKRADAFVSYMNTVNEFFMNLYKVGSETMERIIKEHEKMLKNGSQPKTFKEFYEYWWRENEKAYMNLFKTDDFSKLLGKVVDAGLIVKQNMDKFFEEQLDFLPFPKMSHMKSLYKTVYDLKKEVKKLNKEIDDLIKNKDKNEMKL
ncbi:poly(R)-hydroxyalkanoic acid synthase subunit PhaE [Anaerophilus nitritogenes]|uniref:poly(R)-hydroxyalkanoic acid synthase subunit PhaE n=1 Tax=Anaerophilus nitritogenes TaxID=2498136 RepID=UPI00101BE081|nr:poly(R)-hydroxyalkanoic acid synthase subunit PhaE [Anaerophilus nitritogenes]